MPKVLDRIFRGFSLVDRQNTNNIIYNTNDPNSLHLPPGFSTGLLEFDYIYYVEHGPNTNYGINAIWVGSGTPPSSPPTFQIAINTNWRFEISGTGFNPQFEGFVPNTGLCYMIHYAPSSSTFQQTLIYRITIESVSTTTMRIRIDSVISGTGPYGIQYFSNNNPLYLIQIFSVSGVPKLASLMNVGAPSQQSPLSSLDFDVVHNNHIVVVETNSSQTYINTPPTPSDYKNPLTGINITYRNILIRLGHFYSIRDSINWNNSVNYPNLYDPTLRFFFFPYKPDLSQTIQYNIQTWYPNQNQNLSPRLPSERLVLTQITTNTFRITRVGNVAFPSNAYVWVLVKFEESEHASNFLSNNHTFVFTLDTIFISTTERQCIVNISVLNIFNKPFTLIAGMYHFDTSNNQYYSIYSPELQIEIPGQGNRFDYVFIGTSNRMGGNSYLLGNATGIRMTALSGRYSVFNDPIIKYPPHDSLYVNGYVYVDTFSPFQQVINPTWTNPTTYFNSEVRSKMQDIINRAGRLVYRMYGINVLNQRFLLYSYSSTFNTSKRLDYTKQVYINNVFNTSEVSRSDDFYNLNFKFNNSPLRPCVGSLPLFVPSWDSFIQGRIVEYYMNSTLITYNSFLAMFPYTIHNWDGQVYATRERFSIAWNSDSSVRLVSNFTLLEYSATTYGLVFTIGVPLPRYVNRFFYKTDRAPFETEFQNDFVQTEHELILYDTNNSIMYSGSQISSNSHQYPVDEPDIKLKRLRVENYQPLVRWNLLNDTSSSREYIFRCSGNPRLDRDYVHVITLYSEDTTSSNQIDVVYFQINTNMLLENQQTFVYALLDPPQQLYFLSHTTPLISYSATIGSRTQGNIMTFNPTTLTLTINKQNLQVGRYYVYFRSFPSKRVGDLNALVNDVQGFCDTDRFASTYELDEFRVLPPPPDYDIGGDFNKCQDKMMYFCDEQIRLFTQFKITNLPPNSTEYIFKDQFDRDKYYIYIIPKAQDACGISLKDWCGVEIIDKVPKGTISIRYNVRGRIDDSEIYVPNWNDLDYEMLSRFRGFLELNTDTIEKEEYITSITKEKRTIYRQYTPEYTLTLFLPNSCQLAHLLLIKRAKYWVVESNDYRFSFRVKVLPDEIQYRQIDNEAYIATIKLREIRYPAEYRYELR